MAENNRISSQTLKSQQSVESVLEEDLQSEVRKRKIYSFFFDILVGLSRRGGECQEINLSRASVTLSNGQRAEEATVTIVEMHGEVVPPPPSEIEQIVAPTEAQVEEQEVQRRADAQNRQSVISAGNPRPVSLVSRGRQSTEERKSVESPSGQQAEEKVFAQIRAKKTVANLIAKFNTGAEETAKENQNGGKNKEGAGAVNIQAMRQKFSQQ